MIEKRINFLLTKPSVFVFWKLFGLLFWRFVTKWHVDIYCSLLLLLYEHFFFECLSIISFKIFITKSYSICSKSKWWKIKVKVIPSNSTQLNSPTNPIVYSNRLIFKFQIKKWNKKTIFPNLNHWNKKKWKCVNIICQLSTVHTAHISIAHLMKWTILSVHTALRMCYITQSKQIESDWLQFSAIHRKNSLILNISIDSKLICWLYIRLPSETNPNQTKPD